MASVHSTLAPLRGWDDLSGDWQHLEDPRQVIRYQTIAQHITSRGLQTVLDVGCGTAQLQRFLPDSIRYLGIEPSSLAVTQSHVPIICTTAEAFTDPGPWDMVVFNECLYYCENPAALLRSFAPRCHWMLISIFQRRPGWRERLSRKMNNARCTTIVEKMVRSWTVESDQIIDHWRQWVIARSNRALPRLR